MTQQKAASLTSNLFARKGKASPASLLISELEAAGGEPNGAAGHDAAGVPVKAMGLNGTAIRRKPKAQAELPLLDFVEARIASHAGEAHAEETRAAAAEAAPAASLLERGAPSLRRPNGRTGVASVTPLALRPQPSAEPEDTAPAAGDDDAGSEEALEAETVSGDANVAAIEDAPQEDAPDAEESRLEAPVEAASKDRADDGGTDAVIVEAEAAEPAAAEAKPADTPSTAEAVPKFVPQSAPAPQSIDFAQASPPASVVLRKAAAQPLRMPGPLPSPRAAPVPPPSPPRRAAWRSAAVIALGAALGLGIYLVVAGKPDGPPAVTTALEAPAVPQSASAVAEVPAPAAAAQAPAASAIPAPATAPSSVAELPEPSFDIIRIEPDGQSIIAGRAQPYSEWILLNNGTPIAAVRADSNGEWVVLPDVSLVPGANAFSLVPKTERGKVAIPAPQAEAPGPVPAPDAAAKPAALPASEAAAPVAPSVAEAAGPALPKPKPLQQPAAAALSPAAFQVSEGGSYEVQLASVRQVNDAERERARLAAVFADLLGRMDLKVQEATLEGAGTFFRVRSGAIADLGLARELCRQLAAKGQGCLVVRRPAGGAATAEVVEEAVETPAPGAAAQVPQQAERPQ